MTVLIRIWKAEAMAGSRTRAAWLSRLLMVAVTAFSLAGLLGAQDSTPQHPDETSGTTTATPEYQLVPEPPKPAAVIEEVISPDDQLDISVMDVPELTRQYRVTTAGMIEVPLLKKPIAAAGLTPEQLAQTIREKLQAAGMVNDPFVTVQVANSRSHTVTIAGAVKTPQIYPVPSKITLLDAISQAGGLAPDASDTAIVARGEVASRILGLDRAGSSATAGESTSSRSFKVDLRRLMEDGDPNLNVTLYPGDRVTVQRAGVVYVVGAVYRAGGFVMANEGEHMTVLRAIALANNVKATAATKKAVIIRKDAKTRGGTEQIPLNLNKILEGHEPDQQLLANDILFIPDSAGKKALYRTGEAAAQAASLMIYRVP
ncbi:MAG TPA: polysaccharide biosynthesis/export family protein [Terriglobia bacterium]|nr:polysaccharide biosynthesis/export family protein [Terriglobia bacterium]